MKQSANKPETASGRTLRKAWLITLVSILVVGAASAWWYRSYSVDPRVLSLARRGPEATSLTDNSKLAAALAEARAVVLKSRGRDLQALSNLAALYHSNGYANDTEACWLLLHEKQPKEARWTYALALLAERSVDDVAAEKWLETTAQLASNYSPAWLKLAEMRFKAGRYEEAQIAYQKRLALLPEDAYANLGLARIDLQLNRVAEGRARLEKLLRDAPHFSSAHNFYAGWLERSGDTKGSARERWLGTVAGKFSAAEDPWAEQLQSACFDLGQLILWAEVQAQTGGRNRAQHLLQRAIDLVPADPRPYVRLAKLYNESGKAAQAVTLLEKARQLAAPDAKILSSLAESYLNVSRLNEAVKTAQAAVELDPESVDALIILGSAQEELKSWDDALAAFRQANHLAPRDAEPLARAGLVLSRKGDVDGAYRFFKYALSLQPGYPVATTMLGDLCLQAGRLDEAASYILPYYEQYPGASEAIRLAVRLHCLRALQFTTSGQWPEAEAELNEAQQIDKNNADLAVTRKKMARLREAPK